MAKVATKKKSDPDRILVCTMDFGTVDRVVKRGERVRASDPIVGDGRWFVDASTPPSEWPNMWNEMPDPPDHRDQQVRVQEQTIPAHRQVRSRVDMYWDGGHAPGSPGAKSGRPSGFGTALRMGQLLDVGSEIVRRNPSWFVWPERDVTVEDVERLTDEIER
jgi:hypothetical protein